jgi:integrase
MAMPSRRPFGSVRKRVNFYEASYWYNGRRHVAPTSFVTKGEARAYLASVETDIGRGSWIDPWAGRMSVRELAEEWIASDPTKRESTMAREELTLRLHVFPVLGEHRIERVGPQDVQRLVNSWGETYAPRTVKRNYEVVRAMFGFAVRNDWLARNPCRNVKLPLVDGTRRYDLTPEDVARIASQMAPAYRPMVWVGATLGLRWSEVAGLRVGRLDLVGRKLSVVEAIVRGIGGRNVFGPPKSRAGKRTMFMPTAVVTMLTAHLEEAGLAGGERDALVFTDEDGGPLRYSNWRRRVWLPAAKAAGCEGAGFHDLRRLNATTLVVGGIDVKTAQVRLGHADPRMTLAIYAAAPASVDKAAADVLGERFFGQTDEKSGPNLKAESFRAICAPSDPEEPGASES